MIRIAAALTWSAAVMVGYAHWHDSPWRRTAHFTGLKLPEMTLIYRESWGTDFGRKWYTTWVFKLDDAAAAEFVKCQFPGYRKDVRFLAVELTFLRTSIKIPEQNCYRDERDDPTGYTTIVFAGNLLFVKLGV